MQDEAKPTPDGQSARLIRDVRGNLVPRYFTIKQEVPIPEEGVNRVKQLVAEKTKNADQWTLIMHDCATFVDTALKYAGKVDGLDTVFSTSHFTHPIDATIKLGRLRPYSETSAPEKGTTQVDKIDKPISFKLYLRTKELVETMSLLDDNPFQAAKLTESFKHKQAISMLEERAKRVLATKPVAVDVVPTAPYKGPISAPPDTSAVRATKRTQAILHQFPKSLEAASQSIKGPALPTLPESSRIQVPSLAMQPLAPVVPTAQQVMKDTLDKRLYPANIATNSESAADKIEHAHQKPKTLLPQFQAQVAQVTQPVASQPEAPTSLTKEQSREAAIIRQRNIAQTNAYLRVGGSHRGGRIGVGFRF